MYKNPSELVKERAVEAFLVLIMTDNKKLGTYFTKYKNYIGSMVISNVQKIGVHSYAERVLQRNSEYRIALMEEIQDMI